MAVVIIPANKAFPKVTLSARAITYNNGAIEALQCPEYVRIGYDPETLDLVTIPASTHSGEAHEFKNRIRDERVMIQFRDFIQDLRQALNLSHDRTMRMTARLDENGYLRASITESTSDEMIDPSDELDETIQEGEF